MRHTRNARKHADYGKMTRGRRPNNIQRKIEIEKEIANGTHKTLDQSKGFAQPNRL